MTELNLSLQNQMLLRQTILNNNKNDEEKENDNETLDKEQEVLVPEDLSGTVKASALDVLAEQNVAMVVNAGSLKIDLKDIVSTDDVSGKYTINDPKPIDIVQIIDDPVAEVIAEPVNDGVEDSETEGGQSAKAGIDFDEEDDDGNTQSIKGDVNGDGSVDVTDLTDLSNIILSGTSDKAALTRADINGDGSVDISDITALSNIILGVNSETNDVTYTFAELKECFSEDLINDSILDELFDKNGDKYTLKSEYASYAEDLDKETLTQLLSVIGYYIENGTALANTYGVDLVYDLPKTILEIGSGLSEMADSKGVDKTEYISDRISTFITLKLGHSDMTLEEMNNELALNKLSNELALAYYSMYGIDFTESENLSGLLDKVLKDCDTNPNARLLYYQTNFYSFLQQANSGTLTEGLYYEFLKNDLFNTFPGFDKLSEENKSDLYAYLCTLSPEEIIHWEEELCKLPSSEDENYTQKLTEFLQSFFEGSEVEIADGSFKNLKINRDYYDYSAIKTTSSLVSVDDIYQRYYKKSFDADEIIDEMKNDVSKVLYDYLSQVGETLSKAETEEEQAKAIIDLLKQLSGSDDDETLTKLLQELTGYNNKIVNGKLVVAQNSKTTIGDWDWGNEYDKDDEDNAWGSWTIWYESINYKYAKCSELFESVKNKINTLKNALTFKQNIETEKPSIIETNWNAFTYMQRYNEVSERMNAVDYWFTGMDFIDFEEAQEILYSNAQSNNVNTTKTFITVEEINNMIQAMQYTPLTRLDSLYLTLLDNIEKLIPEEDAYEYADIINEVNKIISNNYISKDEISKLAELLKWTICRSEAQSSPCTHISQEIDGVSTQYQGNTGDCWCLSPINSLRSTEEGLKILNNMIQYNEMDDTVTVTIRGEKFVISNTEVQNCSELSSGNGRIRAIEIALRKYLLEHPYVLSSIENLYDCSIEGDSSDIAFALILGNGSTCVGLADDLFKKAILESMGNNPGTFYSAGGAEEGFFATKKSTGEIVPIYTEHAYTLLSCVDGIVSLINPWESNEILTMPKDQFLACFKSISYGRIYDYDDGYSIKTSLCALNIWGDYRCNYTTYNPYTNTATRTTSYPDVPTEGTTTIKTESSSYNNKTGETTKSESSIEVPTNPQPDTNTDNNGLPENIKLQSDKDIDHSNDKKDALIGNPEIGQIIIKGTHQWVTKDGYIATDTDGNGCADYWSKTVTNKDGSTTIIIQVDTDGDGEPDDIYVRGTEEVVTMADIANYINNLANDNDPSKLLASLEGAASTGDSAQPGATTVVTDEHYKLEGGKLVFSEKTVKENGVETDYASSSISTDSNGNTINTSYSKNGNDYTVNISITDENGNVLANFSTNIQSDDPNFNFTYSIDSTSEDGNSDYTVKLPDGTSYNLHYEQDDNGNVLYSDVIHRDKDDNIIDEERTTNEYDDNGKLSSRQIDISNDGKTSSETTCQRYENGRLAGEEKYDVATGILTNYDYEYDEYGHLISKTETITNPDNTSTVTKTERLLNGDIKTTVTKNDAQGNSLGSDIYQTNSATGEKRLVEQKDADGNTTWKYGRTYVNQNGSLTYDIDDTRSISSNNFMKEYYESIGLSANELEYIAESQGYTWSDKDGCYKDSEGNKYKTTEVMGAISVQANLIGYALSRSTNLDASGRASLFAQISKYSSMTLGIICEAISSGMLTWTNTLTTDDNDAEAIYGFQVSSEYASSLRSSADEYSGTDEWYYQMARAEYLITRLEAYANKVNDYLTGESDYEPTLYDDYYADLEDTMEWRDYLHAFNQGNIPSWGDDDNSDSDDNYA